MPPPPNNPTPGFISLQQWLDANQGAVGAMGQQMADAGAAQARTAQEEADRYAAGQRAGGAADPTGYGQALGDQRKASQTLQGWNTPGGLYDAASQQYGKSGTYTPGENTLDALLLGGSPQVRQGFQAVQKQYGGLDSYLQGRDTTPTQHPAGSPMAPKDPANQTPVNYAPPTPLERNRARFRQDGGAAPAGRSTFTPGPRASRSYDWRV